MFYPGAYIAWAKDVGVDIPQSIQRVVKEVEGERNPTHNNAEPSEEVESTNLENPWKKAGGSQQQKYENYLLRILLGVLIEADLI